MRHVIMRALHVWAALAALAVAASAQTPAPSTQPNAPPMPAATPLDDVHRQLQEQREELERLRATVQEQTQLLQQLLTRERSAPASPAAAVESATYKTSDVATTDTLDAAPSRTGARTMTNTQNANAQTANASAPKPTEITTSLLSSISFSGDVATTDTLDAAPNSTSARTMTNTPNANAQTANASAPKPTEITTSLLSSISFSGDVRLRYEGQFGQLNALPNNADPSILGNELSARNRMRVRLRFAVRGQFGREVAKGEHEFQWGLRFASGTYADVNSSNQTLTDFFTRKAFGLDQAYITYKPARVRGLRLQAGKFEPPWLSTEMTIDVDVTPEGLNELYSRDFKNSTLKNLTFVAWQLPMLERASAFVLDANGHVNIDASHRAGRDLALYGAQVHGRFDFTPTTSLTLSAADLYYSGTQFITPAQFFGAQLQIPVTFTIPANGTTPAQTITTTINRS